MPIHYAGKPDTDSPMGTAWLTAAGPIEEPHWTGYWDLAPDGPPTPLEEAPRCDSPEEIVR